MHCGKNLRRSGMVIMKVRSIRLGVVSLSSYKQGFKLNQGTVYLQMSIQMDIKFFEFQFTLINKSRFLL